MAAMTKSQWECLPNNKRVFLVRQARTAQGYRDGQPAIEEQHTARSRYHRKNDPLNKWWTKYD